MPVLLVLGARLQVAEQVLLALAQGLLLPSQALPAVLVLQLQPTTHLQHERAKIQHKNANIDSDGAVNVTIIQRQGGLVVNRKLSGV